MANSNPNDVAIKIKAMLEEEEAQPLTAHECCIYKVPHPIHKVNEDAYTPKVVSIGPFHHGDPKLLKMEGLKRTYSREFIKRSETNSETLISSVQEMEPKTRGCYSDDIKLSKEEHVMVILVDCCFLLEYGLRNNSNNWTHHDDAISLSPRLRGDIEDDLFLLENQVPFFVLEKLYNLAFDSTLRSTEGCNHPSLLRLALRFFFPDNSDELTLTNVGRIAHFTDLLRKSLLRSSHLLKPSASGLSREAELTQLYSATELNEAGVKFEVNENSQCLLDLELSGHTFRIPFIRVEDWTEIFLRNLLAFEQCHCIHESYLADYLAVFDYLINTDKDVDLLIKKGIIENWLGDNNAVAEMFNSLGINIVNPDFNLQYSRIFEDLNAFCAHPWNKGVATLRRDYCNTPWKTVASIAGIFLLILTVIQTVFSILQGVH